MLMETWQLSINNFTLINAALGSPLSKDLTGQAIINHQTEKSEPG
jgi:hypothetical protein